MYVYVRTYTNVRWCICMCAYVYMYRSLVQQLSFCKPCIHVCMRVGLHEYVQESTHWLVHMCVYLASICIHLFVLLYTQVCIHVQPCAYTHILAHLHDLVGCNLYVQLYVCLCIYLYVVCNKAMFVSCLHNASLYLRTHTCTCMHYTCYTCECTYTA